MNPTTFGNLVNKFRAAATTFQAQQQEAPNYAVTFAKKHTSDSFNNAEWDKAQWNEPPNWKHNQTTL